VLDTKFAPCGSRVCVVKVFSYENRSPRGILQNPNFEQDVPFDNLTQLLFAMDELFDEIQNPRRAMTPRDFVRESARAKDMGGSMPGEEKPVATFRVDVMFRQNASWQGNMVWLDEKKEAQFRSALELVMMMDSALRA
jgi:hypothetical protein